MGFDCLCLCSSCQSPGLCLRSPSFLPLLAVFSVICLVCPPAELKKSLVSFIILSPLLTFFSLPPFYTTSFQAPPSHLALETTSLAICAASLTPASASTDTR